MFSFSLRSFLLSRPHGLVRVWGSQHFSTPPHLPNRQTQSISTRDLASLLFTMSLGLPSIANFTIPSLSSCYVMSLFSNMIRLTSNLPTSVKRKHVDSSSLCRALIVLLLIISGHVHVNPGPSDIAPPPPVIFSHMISASMIVVIETTCLFCI